MKIKTERIGYGILFLLFVFQQPLLVVTKGVIHNMISYFDEIIVLLGILGILIHYGRLKYIERTEKKMIICFIIFDLIGVLSNVLHPLQSVFLNVSDLIVCNRFLVMYLIGRFLLCRNVSSIVTVFATLSKVLIAIIFVLTLHDMFFSPLFPRGDYRYFTYSIKLFFGPPTIFAITNVGFAIVLIMDIGINYKNHGRNIPWICIALFCAFMSLRTKAIAGVMFIILAYLYFVKMKMKSKIIAVIGSTLMLLSVGMDKLVFFFGKATVGRDDFVRAKLLRDSITLARKYFPIGSGFATFGSNIAAEHYSPIYRLMGYGLTLDDVKYKSFLSDSFWPIIIGQTGWGGLAFFAFGLLFLTLIIARIQNNNVFLYLAGISIMAYEFISSTAESAFFHPASCLLFVLLGIVKNLSCRLNTVKEIEDCE